ncbi:MAG: hypothetical protein ACE5IP_01780 [Terriglobia bacterium]
MKKASPVLLHPTHAALIAAGTLIGATLILTSFDLSAPLRLAVSLLPVPVNVFFIITQVRWVRLLDELQQRMELEALVIAFPTTFVSILTFWLLRQAGFFLDASVGEVSTFYLVFMLLLYSLGRAIASRRYQ